MPDDPGPVLVGLFAAREQAARAEAELRAEGYGDDRLGAVWAGADGPCGAGGLGSGVGGDVAGFLIDLGVGAEAAGYYGGEVAAGRCLLLVGGATEGHGRIAIGRHCGTIRVPAASEL